MATMAAACLMSPAALLLSRPHSYQGVLLKALHLGSSFCPPKHTLVLPPPRETDSFHNSRSRLHFSPLAPPRHGFSVKALDVSGPGSIDSPLINSMEMKIKEQLKADEVTVKDAYGDGRHVSIDVISTAFEGQSSVNRQRMVYKAIWEELQNAVHAVDHMRTRTPAEAAQEPLNK